MSSKTKIVVLHMKEIIYTVLFICLGILLVALLTFMFHPKNKETSSSKSTSYQPGIYTSQLTLGDKELEVEVEIPKYCDYLRDKTRIYPDDRWKAIEFYSGRIKGPIDIREVDDDGYVSRKRLETVSIEEDEEEGRSCILFGMVTDVTGEWHQEERLERELGQYREEEATCNGCAGYPKYDQVTGLLSFNRFREEVDSVIASGKGKSCLLVYTDLEKL